MPIANPPARKVSSCSGGRGRLIISTVMPIRNGSRLTATAIARSVIHMTSYWSLAWRLPVVDAGMSVRLPPGVADRGRHHRCCVGEVTGHM